jgi:hypothetical protein
MAQAARYERHGKEPNTVSNVAISIEKAHELVDEVEGHGLARWVGGSYRFIVDIPQKSWAKKVSGGVAVMQMVRGGRGPIKGRTARPKKS